MTAPRVSLISLYDLLVTLLMWFYFLFGFVLFFMPFYLIAYLFSHSCEFAFQRLNHLFFKGFFVALRCLAPGIKWRVTTGINTIQSSVIVCNHLSYLDPLLLISLFPRHKTIVKSVFFKAPIFGWMMKQSGFIPANAQGRLSAVMIEHIEAMADFLSSGGNLFIFPEGTRSRDGVVGPLSKGAFKIARRCRAPIQVLKISGTDKVFTPGRFLFKAHMAATILVERIAIMEPENQNERIPVSEIMSEVRTLMEE